MATDLDPNDALGERLRSLSEPALGQASPDAWAGVQQHRRARRTRHLVAAVGTTVIVLVVAVAAFAATQSGEGGKHVEVVTPSTVAPLPADPPIFDVLPVAKTAQISIANSASPIKAGTEVRIELTQSPHKVGDTINTSMQVCFPYAGGETCDPSVDVHWVEGDSRGNTIYRVTMPGWVRTAAGMRSCEVIG
ncbi:MAG TPA: hypothetical protein VNC41_17700, partial [Acidimicrobiia bacterium]|nr:hypothetical protein [Acidimicrobiia bacterium]